MTVSPSFRPGRRWRMSALRPVRPEKALLRFSSALLFVLMNFVPVTGAGAQGCCSFAPQAGPGSVSGQGVGSLFPGQGWIQASVFSLSTSEQFDETGVEEAYFNGGHLDLQSYLLTGAVGIVTGLEVWAQGTLHSMQFRDASASLHRTGLDDVRVWLRAGRMTSWRRCLQRLRSTARRSGNTNQIQKTLCCNSSGGVGTTCALHAGGAGRSWTSCGQRGTSRNRGRPRRQPRPAPGSDRG